MTMLEVLKSYFHFIFLVLIISIQSFNVRAQLQSSFTNITVTKLTHDEGLSQSVNLFRYEDSYGFMWITASDALNRFDGKNVKVYNLDRYFKDCPQLQQAYGFAEDHEGNLYVGSFRGLYIYHRKKDVFTLQKVYAGEDQTAMPIGFLEGKVYCYNRYWQLVSFDVVSKKVELLNKFNFPEIPTLHQYAASQGFTYLYSFLDSQHQIWLIDHDSVWVYNVKSKELFNPLIKFSKGSSVKISSWYHEREANKVHISTNLGLLTIDVISKKIDWVQKLGNKSLLDLNRCVKNKSLIAFFTENMILNLFDTNTNQIIWEDDQFRKYTGDRNYSFDRSGRLWMSQSGQGQFILDLNPKLLKGETKNSIWQFFKNLGGTSCLAEMSNGDILGNNHVKLNYLDKTLSPIPKSFMPYIPYRKAYDPFRRGVWCFANYSNPNTKESMVFINELNQVESIIGNEANLLKVINDVQPLSKQYILVALESGVYRLNAASRVFSKVSASTKPSPFKFNLLSDSRIAVSYLNGDMSLFKMHEDDSLEFIQDMLHQVQSYYIAKDSLRKQYWVGSNQGVFQLDSNFKTIHKFDVNKRLAANNIYGLLLDDLGNVWCSHSSGISNIDVHTYNIRNFNKDDGIQDWDFNNRCFLKGRDGTLYFGGVSGFNYFKPPLEKVSYYHARVSVEDILVNNKVALTDTNADFVHYLSLHASQNNLVFKVFINDLSGSTHSDIIYRLLPNDTAWQKMTNPGKINFNSLASGDYELELGIYDNFSNRHESQRRIRFSIAPKFYQTWWFFALCLILLAALVYLYIRQRERKLQAQHKAKLEVDILIAETELRALRAQMNPHFVFNCLNSILECIETKHVDKASIYLIKFSKLLRKILHASESASIGIEEEVDILTLYLEMEILRFGESFHYEIILDDTLHDEDIRIPSLLVQPFVENAIWHGLLHKKGDKKVVVRFEKYNVQQVKCIIEDNGIGRSNSKALKESNLKSEEHQSKGIALSENRLSLLGQLQDIQTELNILDLYDTHGNASGTRVEILIPIY